MSATMSGKKSVNRRRLEAYLYRVKYIDELDWLADHTTEVSNADEE